MGPEFTHVLDSLGWAVLHSMWQGGVALLAVIVLRLALRGRSPALRHAGQLAALIGCLVAFLWTFAAYLGQSPIAFDGGATLSNVTGANITDGETQNAVSGLVAAFNPAVLVTNTGLDISRITPILACLWAFGFAVMSLRYAFAFGQVQQLRNLGVSAPNGEWQARFTQLLEHSGLSQRVTLLISSNINGPMTLGMLKPVVLVPVGFLSGLPADQVEAVLLHELAHIRRYDYALNLIQTAVKTVLFFHPAIHIIARWADRDREQACDDLAIRQGRDPLALVRGLASLRLQTQPGLGLAATGTGENTPLMARLTRLTGQSQRRGRPEHLLMSVFSVCLIGSIYLGSTVNANAHPVPPEAPTLPDTVVSTQSTPSVPPVPPAPPVLPRLDATKLTTSIEMERVIENHEILYQTFATEMETYSRELNTYLKSSTLNEDQREHLTDTYVDMIDDMAEQFEDRHEAISEVYETQIEAKIERRMEILEQQLETQERQAEHMSRKNEKLAQKKYAQKQAALARKHAETSKKHAHADNNSRTRHENFRDIVMRELMKDGLIESAQDTVLLSHPKNVMSLNGKALPSGKRGKYCKLFDVHGFTDNKSEVTITPNGLKILTDWKDGRHRTRVTYGTFEH